MLCIPYCRELFSHYHSRRWISASTSLLTGFPCPTHASHLPLYLGSCYVHYSCDSASLVFVFVFFFSCQIFLTMSERRSLRARAPSNRAVHVAASSQPPRKLLRTRDLARTGNSPDAANPAGPPPSAQPSASVIAVGPSAHTTEPPSLAYTACPSNQELLPWYYRCHCAAGYECRDTASSQHPKY